MCVCVLDTEQQYTKFKVGGNCFFIHSIHLMALHKELLTDVQIQMFASKSLLSC